MKSFRKKVINAIFLALVFGLTLWSVFRGENLTHGEYPVKAWEKWVRVEVCDEQGRFAWSHVIMLDK